jgi:16S rRNA (cytosine967-C5)-methyltransferase
MERHRHNLPEWLVQPSKTNWATSFWPLVDALARARRWTCASTR